MTRAVLRTATGLAAGLALVAIAALGYGKQSLAQSFDNFDGGTLDGFDLSPGELGDIEVPSLTDDALTEGIGPDIDLQTGTGQAGRLIPVIPGTGTPVTSISQPETTQAPGVILRALDKTLGRPTDLDLALGETVIFGRIAIRLLDCRYPSEDSALDAFAHLEIFDVQGNALFDGWMVASSPALNALEHPRYDVWVLRCAGPA
jgi:hypothetical protein